jgi:hypothetical protein
MARGNQRDLARAKNAKKNGTDKGRAEDGLTPAQRNERDKKLLAEKVAKKEGNILSSLAPYLKKIPENNILLLFFNKKC